MPKVVAALVMALTFSASAMMPRVALTQECVPLAEITALAAGEGGGVIAHLDLPQSAALLGEMLRFGPLNPFRFDEMVAFHAPGEQDVALVAFSDDCMTTLVVLPLPLFRQMLGAALGQPGVPS